MEEPGWGWAKLTDRGSRTRILPVWTAEQKARAIRRAARRANDEHRAAGRPPVRRKKRAKTGELVDGPAREPFAALVDRAVQYPYCIAQDPENAPRHTLQAMTHETCETIFVGPRSCDLRECERCNGRRFAKYLEAMEAWLDGAQVNRHWLKMLTLTRPNASNLKRGVEEIVRDVRLLRRRPWFKKYVQGGVVAIQWTRHSVHAGWHVHAHLVLVGQYIPRDLIVAAWAELGGVAETGSVGVDIREWRGEATTAFKEALGYVYPSKPHLYPTLDDYATVEIDLKGRRLVQTFGKLHGVRVPRAPKYCPACMQQDSHWLHQGTPTECDHAAFVATVTSEQHTASASALVRINRTKKAAYLVAQDSNPRVRIARRREASALERERRVQP